MSDAPADPSGDDRPPGPVPQGSPPPSPGGSGGPSPTGHPEASPAASSEDAAPDPTFPGDSVEGEEVEEVGEDELSDEDLELSEMEARLLGDLDRLQGERNEYLDQLLRTRADFDNYRKRLAKQQAEHEERAAGALVEKLLDVLDTFDMAVAHSQGYEQVRDRLIFVLGKEGLERIDPVGDAFDPNEADAVAHEAGDDGPVVAEVLRAGYRWKGRVLRPAMVKVKG